MWNYIFLKGPEPTDSDLSKETLATLRREFEYWYPMDLRVSAKDLIPNHLTMALYNHTEVSHLTLLLEDTTDLYWCPARILMGPRVY